MADRGVGADGDILQKDVGNGRFAPAMTVVDTDGSALGDGGGNLKVNVVAGGVTITAGIADNVAFSEGTTPFAAVGGEYKDSPTAPTASHAAAGRITIRRALVVAAEAAINLATAQQTSTGSAVAITGAPSRPTRRRVLLSNTDSANDCFIGPSGVTTGTGVRLVHGAPPREFRTIAALFVIDGGSHAVIDVQDEYD